MHRGLFHVGSFDMATRGAQVLSFRTRALQRPTHNPPVGRGGHVALALVGDNGGSDGPCVVVRDLVLNARQTEVLGRLDVVC